MRVAARFSMRQPIPKSREIGIRVADVPQGTKRRILVALGGLLLAAALGGVLVVASGIIPIGASSGHWPITEWFLQFAMHRSVSTHSLGVQVPPLNDPDLILKGATHYEIGCRPCHGSPGIPQPRIPGRMTPHPPDLPQRIRDSKPQELFYVVKHGVKFTGMPAWPALQREDEVWAVVAFLQELAHLDEAGYRRLQWRFSCDRRDSHAGRSNFQAIGGHTELCALSWRRRHWSRKRCVSETRGATTRILGECTACLFARCAAQRYNGADQRRVDSRDGKRGRSLLRSACFPEPAASSLEC